MNAKGLAVKVVSGQEQFKQVFDDILQFCKVVVEELKNQMEEEDFDLRQTVTNMGYKNWDVNNECLLYRIYKAKKFDDKNGMLVLLYQHNKIIALSGVEMWNEKTVSLGKRAYTLKKYRNQLINTKILMPLQIKWAKKKHPGAFLYIVTVNEYLKDKSFSALKYWIKEKIDFWKDWKVYDGTLEFYKIPQYFVYCLVDKSLKDSKHVIKNIIVGGYV